jgi:hypothetical protein
MNRLIKLFQKKADDAFEVYLRAKNSDELSKQHAVLARVTGETWQAAADMLRKEELNK